MNDKLQFPQSELVKVHATNDVGQILGAGAATGRPQQLIGSKPYAVVPEGYEIKYLEEKDDTLARVEAHPEFLDAASFIAYVNRFKDGDSTVFADIDSSKVVAVLDYHEAVLPDDGAESSALPRHCQHLATLLAKPSKEWALWVGKNGTKMGQVEFSEFLENNSLDIVSPEPAVMLQVASTLEAKKAVNFASAVRLDNGQVNFSFNEDTQGTAARGQLQIPQVFTVALSPYVGCSRYKVEARFRYRIGTNGQLALWFDLLRHEPIQRDAFEGIMKAIGDQTSIQVLLGKK